MDFMKQENEKLHKKLDALFAMIEREIQLNPTKARDLILHCLDLMKVNATLNK